MQSESASGPYSFSRCWEVGNAIRIPGGSLHYNLLDTKRIHGVAWRHVLCRSGPCRAGGEGSLVRQRGYPEQNPNATSAARPTALHGDLHHFNVLRAERAAWLAIDPEGLAGDPCFDACQFLRNPVRVPASVNRRRLDIFCAELGLDRARVRAWCFVHALLDACWAFEDGDPWQETVAYAAETLSF